MAKWSKRIKVALDEVRMMVLGVQVLVSLQFELAFQSGFATASPLIRRLIAAVLLLLMASFALLLWGPSYHRVAVGGNCTRASLRFMSRASVTALCPLAVALAVDLLIACHRVGMRASAVAAGISFVCLCFTLWFFMSLTSRRNGRQESSGMNQNRGSEQDEEVPELHERVELALTEARVVLPGAQAMLGFQFVTMFTQSFEQLPESSKLVHLLCLSFIALTVVLLITPAAFHRIAENGEDSERLVRLTGHFVMGATIPLAAGMSGEVFVVLRKVIGSFSLATGAAIATFLIMLAMWFGYTLLRRRTSHHRRHPAHALSK